MPTRRTMPVPLVSFTASERCSVMATLGIIGDFWTMGVLRCAAFGVRRFGEFQSELGVATNVLTDRLSRLVGARILERVPYQERPPRHEYALTADGVELAPIIVALKHWGDHHLQTAGPWTSIRHQGCSSSVEVAMVCPDCGTKPSVREIETVILRTA
jgi:DNA-binding HxlR family transcriptional regulator